MNEASAPVERRAVHADASIVANAGEGFETAEECHAFADSLGLPSARADVVARVLMQAPELGHEIVKDTLNVLLKYEADIEATMPQVSTFIAKATRQNVFG